MWQKDGKCAAKIVNLHPCKKQTQIMTMKQVTLLYLSGGLARQRAKGLLLSLLLLTALAVQAASPRTFDINLWPDGPKTSNGDAKDQAKMMVFLPDEKKATGRAVVICPGGGYRKLSMQNEGTDWAPFFNEQGIAVAVLKYRMPHGHCTVPAEDAEEAMRIVRRHAGEWHINKNDVGIMGFSAGGHLASTVATHATGDAAPDFQILFYPVVTMEPGTTHQGSYDNLLGKNPKRKLVNEYCNEQHVSKHTPKAFLALASDDQTVSPLNSTAYYEALHQHGVPATMHIYRSGGHGFGMRQAFAYHLEMLLELKAWLRSF